MHRGSRSEVPVYVVAIRGKVVLNQIERLSFLDKHAESGIDIVRNAFAVNVK